MPFGEYWASLTPDRRQEIVDRAQAGHSFAAARRRVVGWLETGRITPDGRRELAGLLLDGLDPPAESPRARPPDGPPPASGPFSSSGERRAPYTSRARPA